MITTIQINEDLKSKLDKLKVHHRETYNELLSRLVEGPNLVDDDRESLIATIEVLSDPELMMGIKEALEEEQRGKEGTSLGELKKELGLQ